MSRPSFESIYMGLAWKLAERSTCSRLRVGAVLTTTDFRKVLAVGYNGGAAGQSNACESEVPGNCGHLHAELNAIINCDAPRGTDKFAFVSHMPCPMCSRALVNLGGVKRLWYSVPYRDASGVVILCRAGIDVEPLVLI